MTNEKQQIAIAEACQWAYRVERYSNGEAAGGNWVSPDGVGRMLPDYLNDLNAMHDAEKTLSYEKLLGFDRHLYELFQTSQQQKCIHATAAERAEAFLRALGRWTDDNDDLRQNDKLSDRHANNP